MEHIQSISSVLGDYDMVPMSYKKFCQNSFSDMVAMTSYAKSQYERKNERVQGRGDWLM